MVRWMARSGRRSNLSNCALPAARKRQDHVACRTTARSAAAAAAAATAAGRWGAIQLWEHPPLQYEPGGARLVLFEGLDELLAKLPVLGIFSVSGGILEPHWGDFRMIAGWLVPSGLRAPAQHVVYRQLWLGFHPTLLILLTLRSLLTSSSPDKKRDGCILVVRWRQVRALAKNHPGDFQSMILARPHDVKRVASRHPTFPF